MKSKGAGDALHSPEFMQEKRNVRPISISVLANLRARRRAAFSGRRLIEPVEDAERYRQKNLTTLRKCQGQEALVHDIEQCSETRPCGRVLCPLCARLYRIWFAEETLRWLHRSKHHRRPAKTLVVRLEQASNPDLPMVSIGRLQDQLRKRLLRSGISRVIGGTEASYNLRDKKWTAHFHLLIFGASERRAQEFRAEVQDGRKSPAPSTNRKN